ncbi:MAG: polysaccharide deacetylase family protein [Bacillota bacterium]|jgi:peptidoglycan/xylan/chitin deacetylase (PgdA/CDA1 family)|nr:polysaccharide deacetylase family protein [Thermoanaerobacteraceae bacterium]
MRLRGTGRLRRAINRFFRRVRPQAVILLYHRVVEVPADPQLLCVKPVHFAAHLAHVRQNYRPVSLTALNEALQQGEVPDRAVVLTFDDGYADNLHHAKPILERYAVPATVFVTAGKIDNRREFWWDELERLLLLPDALPERLELTINGRKYSWTLEGTGGPERFRPERYRYWNITLKDDPTPRHKCYRELCALLRPLTEAARQAVLAELVSLTGADPLGRPEYRPLTTDEVRALAAGGLVTVGAHTLTHPVLAALPAEEQQREIEESKRRLESILGQPVTSFSYPYGAKGDYTPETLAMVRQAGFVCACANFADTVWRGSDPFQLPRFLIRDWDRDEFAEQVRAWFRE